MDYKLIVTLVVAALIGGGVGGFVGGSVASKDSFGATTARTTITNPWTFTQSVTQSATSTANGSGTVSYETKEGIDYAYVQQSLDTTNPAAPAIVLNPFGTATTSVDHIKVVVTTGVTGAAQYDIATTTSCTGNAATSTPRFVWNHNIATGAQDTLTWRPQLFASSTNIAKGGELFTDTGFNGGSLPFVIAGSECLVMRVATGTEGTYAGGFWVGTFSAVFSKP